MILLNIILVIRNNNILTTNKLSKDTDKVTRVSRSGAGYNEGDLKKLLFGQGGGKPEI